MPEQCTFIVRYNTSIIPLQAPHIPAAHGICALSGKNQAINAMLHAGADVQFCPGLLSALAPDSGLGGVVPCLVEAGPGTADEDCQWLLGVDEANAADNVQAAGEAAHRRGCNGVAFTGAV